MTHRQLATGTNVIPEALESTQPTGVSVVICAYTEDRWPDLLAAVASVQRQSQAPEEIIVVIDHNARLFARARDGLPGVTVVQSNGTPGLSDARNTGVALAKGQLIAFMDEDAVADADWLERLAARFQDDSVLGVGGAILPNWQTGRPRWFPAEFDWVVGCTYRGMPVASAPVRNLIGCNMSFRRDVVEAGAGFRSEMGRVGTRPLGCEETELCIRILQRRPDGLLLYEPSAQVNHRVPPSRARLTYFVARCYSEGLSKATVTRLVGAGDGLASERTYTLRTLPEAVLRGVRDAFLRGDIGGLQRAAAVIVGFSTTLLGYGLGRAKAAFKPAQTAVSRRPGLTRDLTR